jgi:hypothetical protein
MNCNSLCTKCNTSTMKKTSKSRKTSFFPKIIMTMIKKRDKVLNTRNKWKLWCNLKIANASNFHKIYPYYFLIWVGFWMFVAKCLKKLCTPKDIIVIVCMQIPRLPAWQLKSLIEFMSYHVNQLQPMIDCIQSPYVKCWTIHGRLINDVFNLLHALWMKAWS